jgi:hypothetical protein
MSNLIVGLFKLLKLIYCLVVVTDSASPLVVGPESLESGVRGFMQFCRDHLNSELISQLTQWPHHLCYLRAGSRRFRHERMPSLEIAIIETFSTIFMKIQDPQKQLYKTD